MFDGEISFLKLITFLMIEYLIKSWKNYLLTILTPAWAWNGWWLSCKIKNATTRRIYFYL